MDLNRDRINYSTYYNIIFEISYVIVVIYNMIDQYVKKYTSLVCKFFFFALFVIIQSTPYCYSSLHQIQSNWIRLTRVNPCARINLSNDLQPFWVAFQNYIIRRKVCSISKKSYVHIVMRRNRSFCIHK